MSHQYNLYPTTSAAGTAATATSTAMAMAMAMAAGKAPPLTPRSLSTMGRSSTSTSSVSWSKGSAGGNKRESKDSKASVVSRKDWMEAPLPVGVTIRGRGMWCFVCLLLFCCLCFRSYTQHAIN